MALSPSDPRQTGRDRSDDETGKGASNAGGNAVNEGNATEANATFDFLAMVRVIEERDEIFKGAIQRNNWRRAYDAWHNRHASDSKYADASWRRKRTSLFRPKTRAAVRRALATAAASLFTTSDVVQVEAEQTGDQHRSASAAVVKELLNYRLDRTSEQAGMPWFMICVGACLDGQITGVCYSKQHWEYETVVEKALEVVELEHLDENGDPMSDPATGEPIRSTTQREVKKEFVIKDRPMVTNIAPDNVMIDPTAPWINPVQSSGYLIVKWPMTLGDCKTMLANPGKAGTPWLQVPEELLRQVCDDYTSKGVRTARASDRVDPYDTRVSQGGPGGQNDIVWLYECFLRVDGVDYHMWTLGSRFYASKVRTTRMAYPEQRGQRPLTRGYAALETHETFPMAPVLSWQEMQKELNDVVNLRLDTMKQALSPIAKVRQGSTFDFSQLQNRAGSDTTIIVRQMDDLEFDRSPDVTAAAYQETDRLNADFDDLAGVFSAGSVNTNRNLNETVGGMQLLNGSASATNEFDLRIIIETWVEPTLRQVVRLEQQWEDDDVIFAIAGSRANMMERFGIDQITDTDLEREVTVRVNVGLGSADPMQRLTKLRLSMATIAPLMPFFDRGIKIKAEEIIKEVMGAAGYNDGMRFIELQDGPMQMPGQDGQGGQQGDPNAVAVAGIDAKIKQQLALMDMQSKASLASGAHENSMQMETMKQNGAMLQLLLKEVVGMRKHQMTTQANQRQHTTSTMASMLTGAARNANASHVAGQRSQASAKRPGA